MPASPPGRAPLAGRAPAPLFAVALGLLLVLAILVSFAVGRFALGPDDVRRLLWARASGAAHGLAPNAETVFWQIRAPRVLSAALCGAALAAAGAALQSVFRNPLAAPDLLGVSAGAALGAVLGIFLGWGIAAIQAGAFVGGLVAVALVYAVGQSLSLHDRALSLVLSGIAIGSVLGALVALIKTLADPYTQLPAITFWLLGSFSAIDPVDLGVLGLGAAIGVLPLLLLRWRADALALSDDEVRSLGIDVRRLRMAMIVGATLATAVTVATAGIIGWIGLVVPHAARLVVGARFSRLLPVSMLLGALLMLVIDTAGRGLAQAEVPPGVLSALLGAPVLFLLMLRRAAP